MVSKCIVPGGVGSITASGKKLQERMLTVCQQCLLWFLNKKYCAVHVASLSLFDLIGLSFACTGKNGDLIARASRKTSVPVAVKVPSGRQSKWLLGKPFLAKKPILDTEPSLHVQELLAPPYSSP